MWETHIQENTGKNTISIPLETQYLDTLASGHGMCDTTERQRAQRGWGTLAKYIGISNTPNHTSYQILSYNTVLVLGKLTQ